MIENISYLCSRFRPKNLGVGNKDNNNYFKAF